MKKKLSTDVIVSVRTATRIPRLPAAMSAKKIIARTCKMSRMKMNNKRKNAIDILRRVKRSCCIREESKKPLTAKKLPFLPMDVVASILSWLPVKSLVRLRAACKQWRSLTYDPSFVAVHHDRSLALGRLALISPLNGSSVFLYDLGQHGQVRDVSFDARFEEPIRYRFSNSNNGLVCAYRDTSNYIVNHGGGGDHQYLLNPFSRELVKLPTSNRESWGINGVSVGLGFDTSTGVYKLVRVFGKEGSSECCCLEVLELGGSCSAATGVREWRYVGDVACRIPPFTPVFVKGALHWMVKGYGNASSSSARAVDLFVLAFDVKYERVRLMRPPHKASLMTCRLVESPSGHLSVMRCPILWTPWPLQNLLILLRRGLEREALMPGPDARKPWGSRYSLTIWSLHDYENDDKWIEEHNIDMFEIATTLCMGIRPADVALGLGSHEVLFLMQGETTTTQSICAFDLHAMTLRELCARTSASKLNFITESLVSPRSLAGNLVLPCDYL